MYVRTKAKGTEFKDDRHHFTNKWTEVAEGEIGSVHIENPNLEVREDKSNPKTVVGIEEPGTIPEPEVAPVTDGA